MAKRSYTKQPLKFEEQLQILKDRKLIISDDNRALRYLRHISYYRLSAYSIPFQDTKDVFNDGVTFDDVLNLYLFDRELRVLVFDAIERIEIAIRTQMIHHLSNTHGAHWHEDKNVYVIPYIDPNGKLINTHKTVNSFLKSKYNSDSKEEFIKHYLNEYDNPPFPPSWMALELLTLGNLSRIYSDLELNSDKKAIAEYFGVHHTIFDSWLHSLTYCRNLAAHHSRFWNRDFHIQPKILNKTKNKWIDNEFKINNRSFYYLSIIKFLLNTIIPKNTFTSKIDDLIKKYPKVPIRFMGIPSNGDVLLDWKSQSVWNN